MSFSDLRIQSIKRRKAVTIRINGRNVPAFEGEPLHAVLLAAGFRTLRTSFTESEPRGFLCGMGVCYECLVTVDDIPEQTACVTEVYDGMKVEIDAV